VAAERVAAGAGAAELAVRSVRDRVPVVQDAVGEVCQGGREVGRVLGGVERRDRLVRRLEKKKRQVKTQVYIKWYKQEK